jgi:hypothetical protein
MVLTINPAVCGVRGSTKATIGFAVGAAIAGALVAVVAGTVGRLIGHERAALVAFPLVLLAVAREAGLPLPVPYRPAQVPEVWRRRLGPWSMGLAYGGVLGTGFLTHFLTSAHLAGLCGIAVAGSPPLAALFAILWMVGKVSPLLAGWGRASEEEVLAVLPQGPRDTFTGVVARRTAGIVASALVLAAIAGAPGVARR